MDYDPIKDRLAKYFGNSSFSRKLFFKFLDIILLRSWHLKREIRKWKRIAPYNAHILDAGCGFGQMAYFLSKQNPKWNIRAIDINRIYIGKANCFFREQKLQQVYCTAEDLTQFSNPNSFDLVFSSDTLKYIENDDLVFANFYESLKNKGVLLMSVPNADKALEPLRRQADETKREYFRDGYSVGELKEKLKAAGFNKIKVHYSYSLSGKIGWKLAMKWPMNALVLTKVTLLFLPIYYLLTAPIILVLHWFDTYTPHYRGAGLIVRAEKNEVAN